MPISMRPQSSRRPCKTTFVSDLKKYESFPMQFSDVESVNHRGPHAKRGFDCLGDTVHRFRRSSRSGKGASYMTKALYITTWILAIILCNVANRPLFARATSPSAEGSDQQGYEWESWNFYKILGLEDQESPSSSLSGPSISEIKKRTKRRRSLDTKDVRKAYRKQAQLWHPDKHAHKAKQEEEKPTSGSSLPNKVSIEECNARFARISEAYQILSSDETRQEYDQYLEHSERNGMDRWQQDHRNFNDRQYQNPYGDRDYSDQEPIPTEDSWTWAEMFDRVTDDPRKVFEEFFYGWFDDGSKEAADRKQDHGQQNRQQQQRRRNQMPVRTFEKEEYVNDPYTGEQLLRIIQKHEFATDPDSGQFYFRVDAQEFRRVGFHMYRGWQVEPISDPYLVEEGYQMDPRYAQYHRERERKQRVRREQDRYSRSRGQQSRRSQNEEQHRRRDVHHTSTPSHVMMPGDILSSGSRLLVSPNGHYYAGMSPQCELLVVLNNTQFSRDGLDDVEDEVVWSSDTFAPHGSCFAALQSSRLIITLGEPHQPIQTLWVSDEEQGGGFLSDLLVQHSRHHPLYTSESAISYQLQLDNDGSLTVYRIKTVTRQYRSAVSSRTYGHDDEDVDSDSPWSRWKHVVTEYLEPLSSPPPEKPTHASRAWTYARYWASDTFLGSTYLSRENVGPNFGKGASIITYKTCIFTTSPMGCNRPARRSRQLVMDVQRQVVWRLRGAADVVLELLLDGSGDGDKADEGTDIWDRLLGLCSAGMHGLQRRLKDFQRSQEWE